MNGRLHYLGIAVIMLAGVVIFLAWWIDKLENDLRDLKRTLADHHQRVP